MFLLLLINVFCLQATDKVFITAENIEGQRVENFATEQALKEYCPILYEQYKMISKGTILIYDAWENELKLLRDYFNAPDPKKYKIPKHEYGWDHFLEIIGQYDLKDLQQSFMYTQIIDRQTKKYKEKSRKLFHADDEIKQYILKTPEHVQRLWGLLASKYWLLQETPKKAPKIFAGHQLASLNSIKYSITNLNMDCVEGTYKIGDTLWLRTKNYLYKYNQEKEKFRQTAAIWLPKTKINENNEFSYKNFVVTSDEAFIFMLYSAGYSGLRLIDGKTQILLADVRLSEKVDSLNLQNDEKLWFSKENDNTPHYSLSIKRFYKLHKIYASSTAKKLLHKLALEDYMVNTIQ